jgi:hypothetical protein
MGKRDPGFFYAKSGNGTIAMQEHMPCPGVTKFIFEPSGAWPMEGRTRKIDIPIPSELLDQIVDQKIKAREAEQAAALVAEEEAKKKPRGVGKTEA